MWSINQITNPSINITTENAQVVDALGSVIAEFDRGRQAEFSAENSLFDLSLYAAQLGQEKVESDATIIPALEEITYTSQGVTLKHTPIDGSLPFIYELNPDGTLGKAYEVGTAAAEDVCSLATNKITFPTNVKKGTFMAVYEYEGSGVAVVADAINFPKSGKFTLEVLGADVCRPDQIVHAYIVFHNAKLDGNVDYSFTTDGTHPFTIKANQAYCDYEKRLFSIIIPNEE